ncbi:MAG TPA: hypothetical protein PK402_14565, partial [Tepidisphaeraceae bacterium]|nr:hypothetical protein [Tepidisphaeraceae bacterium]
IPDFQSGSMKATHRSPSPGTAMKFAERFFSTATNACVNLNRRGVLLTRHAEQIPASLPASVRHVSYAPFGALLPRVGALVHHGGIGTTAQALRAACPQLVTPLSHDQFDNGYRCKRLGVADVVDQSHFKEPRVTQALRRLIDDETIKRKCDEIARRFAGETPLDLACAMIESVAPTTGGTPVPPEKNSLRQ